MATYKLPIFTKSFQETFYPSIPIQKAPNWKTAFELFTAEMKKLNPRETFILFLDELPWLSTPKSGLLQALDHYWNTEWNQLPHLKVILCGSAASWMLENLIHAKGGLHNRITQRIHLQPFTLAETREFLLSRNVDLNHDQTLELYMAFGGIPFYLKEAEKGKSAAQIINQTCFSKNGLLRDEFERLFPSLFDHSEIHTSLFQEIVKNRSGVSRNQLMEKLSITSGGRLNQRLQELEEAGFISSYIPYGKKRKDIFYRCIDEYCYFYSKWIAQAPKGIYSGSTSRYWEQKRGTPSWRSWAGYTFEGICQKHAANIRNALGLNAIGCETGTWRFVPPKVSKVQESKTQKLSQRGAQIDLLFDRDDGIITLCEIKHSQDEFTIDRSYADELQRKMEVFQHHHGPKKQIFITLITPHGVAKNQYYGKYIHSEVTLKDLFVSTNLT